MTPRERELTKSILDDMGRKIWDQALEMAARVADEDGRGRTAVLGDAVTAPNMTEDPKTVSLWEMSCERKKRGLGVNRVTLTVVGSSLSAAMAKAEAFAGNEWTIWSARHVGHRVVVL